jgi:hypothetical protein
MNILCDFHHSDLWWSNHLIMEVALGHKLFCPSGMEWFERGYFGHPSIDVARQYLMHSFFKLEEARHYPQIYKPLIDNAEPSMRFTPEHINGCKYYPLIRTLTVDEFADTEIDIIMTTLSNNQGPWLKLRNDFKPKTKLIREEGNPHGWMSLHPEYKNVMTSDLPTFRKSLAPNKVIYHQKFDTERVFYYREPQRFDRIVCFLPTFRAIPDLVSFTERHDLGQLELYDYGHFSQRGFLSPKEKYAQELARSCLVWHVKPGGDGFGHVIHSALAMGRPVVTKPEDYRDNQVWPLLLDGKTCILIGDNPAENSKKIKAMLEPERLIEMSHATRDRFRNLVDYGWEQEEIKAFLERLV